MKKPHFRSVFISDLHLGAKKSQARTIHRFLKKLDCENLYLVGDVLDIWRIKQLLGMGRESKKHFVCINKILRLSSRMRVVYVTGNHDEFLNSFLPKEDGGGSFILCERCVHETANGGRLLIMHGHQFDLASRFPRHLLLLGDLGYDVLLRLNRIVNGVRRLLGRSHWSLSLYLKTNLKKAINFLNAYERMAVETARRNGCQGVVCGHVHTPSLEVVDGVTYCNTGCWTEELNCSYVVEHWDGRLELRRFE